MDRSGNTEPDRIRKTIFNIRSLKDFNGCAIEIFHLQYEKNEVYRTFVDLAGIRPGQVRSYNEMPFLPVQFFRDKQVITGDDLRMEKIFASSSTTGSVPGKHYIHDLSLYKESFTKGFKHFYREPAEYCFLALLPGYLERSDSSLVYMMDQLISTTSHNGSGFYLDDYEELARKLELNKINGQKTILLGVSFALLDFLDKYRLDLPDLIVMETGGMKGRRREIIREELHSLLCSGFGVKNIHSEYGMTELLSQAYSQSGGIFRTPPWMKVLIRDINDPFTLEEPGKTGGINIIDLANIYSCSFVASQDLGRLRDDGSFEVLGRYDDSDVRGCNLLV